ncbi:MAG: exonuclease SbcCD subunit D [Candidatus Gracilibacteria bacterium]|nr:exonuclease SbcCD subunit D [Candidatus Gracilibacteria bacterium]
MKIIHFSDTHLGYNISGTKRDDDFYKNFNKVIKMILKEKPDFVIHTGDLFHTSNPSNKAISKALNGFLKLSENKINTIIIAGNHSKPRLNTSVCPLEIFKELDYIFPIYSDNISNIEFDEINFVCLPHIHDEEIFKKEFKRAPKLKIKNKINIFMSHFGLQAKDYDEYTDEISGVNIEINLLEDLKTFDYVALGHYHKNFCLSKNICYSGSTEHTSFNQKSYKLGVNLLEFKNNKLYKKTINLDTRKIEEIFINCENFNNFGELENYLENQNFDIENKIIKVIFENMNSSLLLGFNDDIINKYFKDSFYFEYKKLFIEDKKSINNIEFDEQNISSNLLDNFIENYDLPDNFSLEDKQKLKQEILNNIK